MARKSSEARSENCSETTVVWLVSTRLPPTPAMTPARVKAKSLVRVTLMPREAAAPSDPRTAAKARPVLLSRRLSSANMTVEATASMTK
jgi:hypothetical protein